MDNLRSLNSSLPTPGTSRRQRSGNLSRQASQQSQHALLQAFKTAALSVTNLYRAAAADANASSYSDGYRNALEDLVEFLDREDLGLGDGEGWRVRQYLAEKLTQSPEGSEDEGADGEEEKRARSSSPVLQTKTGPQQQQPQPQQQVAPRARSSTPTRTGAAVPQHTDSPHMQFTFQAGHQMQDMDVDGSLHSQPAHRTTPRTRHGTTTTLRLNSQSHNRAAAGLASSKRKLPLVDFFDITEFGNVKDGTTGGAGAGGKRSRLL